MGRTKLEKPKGWQGVFVAGGERTVDREGRTSLRNPPDTFFKGLQGKACH